MSTYPVYEANEVDFNFKIHEDAAKVFIQQSDRLAYRIREFKKCLRDMKVSHYFFYPDPGVKGVRKPDKTEVLVRLLDDYLQTLVKYKQDWQLLSGQMESIMQQNRGKELLDENTGEGCLSVKKKKNRNPLEQCQMEWTERLNQLNSMKLQFVEKEEKALSYVLGLVSPGESIHHILTQWSVFPAPDTLPYDLESLLTLMTAHPMGLRDLLKG